MPKVPKIHIFHISEYGGHSQAAQNIREAILANEDKVEVINLNSFQYFYPRAEKIVNFIYTIIIKRIPSLWGKAYNRKNLIRHLLPWQKAISLISFPKLNRYIKLQNPDCFVTTQAFPCGLIADYKKKYKVDIPLVAVVTDFYPHYFWVHPFVDRYVVASNQAKEILKAEGISENRIAVFGIPISINFRQNCCRNQIAKKWGFIPKLKSILVMGGGLGIGPIEEVVNSLAKINLDFQIIVICGKNRFLYQKLQKRRKKIRKPLFVFSFVGQVNEIMDFCDIIITKAGGVTVSEALAKKMAIIVTNPIPGQEEFNVDFLIGQKAILRADTPSEIRCNVSRLLENGDKLNQLKSEAEKNSFPDSSLKIANLVDSLVRP